MELSELIKANCICGQCRVTDTEKGSIAIKCTNTAEAYKNWDDDRMSLPGPTSDINALINTYLDKYEAQEGYRTLVLEQKVIISQIMNIFGTEEQNLKWFKIMSNSFQVVYPGMSTFDEQFIKDVMVASKLW